MKGRALLLGSLSAAAAVYGLSTHGVTTSPTAVANQTFDYIVIGGGLTGLTVAARLAENSAITVLVCAYGFKASTAERSLL